ncbi:hypothetical protein [Pseudomonas oryzihabitans]|uniref:hypothetical protein n=1 Tax=Pseudomonas oryzihabitans TaxID=47885 RepID=UPI00241E0820|nr:hypothetical protein [Pseudomonas oryzihabitans]
MKVPAPIAAQGRQLVALGQAMQNPNTTVQQLLELSLACGIALPAGRQQVQHQESRHG